MEDFPEEGILKCLPQQESKLAGQMGEEKFGT